LGAICCPVNDEHGGECGNNHALRRLMGHPRLQTMIVETFQGLSLKSLHDHGL